MLKYYNKVVLYNHQISNRIGIITGWKNPPEIKNLLNEEALKKVMTIGTLYTKEGILERQFKGNNANKLRSECCFLDKNLPKRKWL